jgi:hypothetical protein
MDVGKVGVVDAVDDPLAAEAELAVERVLVDSGAAASPRSKLVGRFSFCKL